MAITQPFVLVHKQAHTSMSSVVHMHTIKCIQALVFPRDTTSAICGTECCCVMQSCSACHSASCIIYTVYMHISCSVRLCELQLRRTRAWFPCVDQPLAACPFELHFTVPASQMAISCGQLIKQKWADGAKRRTFHYKLSIATPPQDIALVVGECVFSVCFLTRQSSQANECKSCSLGQESKDCRQRQHKLVIWF